MAPCVTLPLIRETVADYACITRLAIDFLFSKYLTQPSNSLGTCNPFIGLHCLLGMPSDVFEHKLCNFYPIFDPLNDPYIALVAKRYNMPGQNGANLIRNNPLLTRKSSY